MTNASITFTQIAELYVQELRAGSAPQVMDYARAFPHLEAEIRHHFPTMRLMESAYRVQELQPGNVLGECVIESEIGRGGMGIVYRAYDKANDRKVALKVLPLNASDVRASQRFQQEREAMSRLSHPNIVPVYAHGSTDDFAYLVIKLIDGFNLEQVLKHEAGYRSTVLLAHWRSDWQSFAHMASQLASGLQHAHENGLVHRDVKPANLLVDSSGKIWISDFGLAKLWDSPHSVSMTGDVVGTPRYMAPEQNQGICDARSDIFSLGATLYELACGERVSRGETVGSIIVNRATCIRDIRSLSKAIPDELAKIIMRACQYDPSNRYQTARELQHVLDRYCQGHPQADRRDDSRPSDEVYKQRSRKNIRLGLAVGSCICLATLAYPLFYRLYSGPSPLNATVTPEQKSATMVELESTTQKLIDRLAQGDEDDVVEVVSTVLQSSINSHSTRQWHYSEKAKQELLERVAAIKQLFVDHRLGPEHMNQFMNLYRTSTLAVAGRLLHVIPQIEQNLSEPRARAVAFEQLKQFSSAIINRAVDKNDANFFIEKLVRGRFNSIEQSTAVRIDAQELNNWLNEVQVILDQLPADVLQAHKTVPEELELMFQEAFGFSVAKKR